MGTGTRTTQSSAGDVAICAATHRGLVAAHNDDVFVIADLDANRIHRRADAPLTAEADQGGVLLLVCDGVGGAGGEVAAWMGSEAIVAALHRDDRDGRAPIARLLHALEVANREVVVETLCAGIEGRMGATCTACWILGRHAYFVQVGDSRGYRLRGGALHQVTVDRPVHTRLLEEALGAADAVHGMVSEVVLERGDVILLCTDGLHQIVSTAAIRDALLRQSHPRDACRELVRVALQAGAPGNVTAVVARCEGASSSPGGHRGR